jgi:hypothetical protein
MKYLEVDDGLKFDDHVDFICKKMGQEYGFMSKQKAVNQKQNSFI